MYLVKNLKTNETMRFETMEAVAQCFNFFENIYENGVWERFIELLPSYEIKRVEDNINVTLTKQCEDKEDEDDLVF